ncbi:MAG: hypothetical protein B9S32_12490 [Verrucomicrobia bacterium Tous-C9LFEB]|nr:MAG: hypothetical protein B9S32_12490 [Verrucomicrobia bacterium Tous-C9LFEB]
MKSFRTLIFIPIIFNRLIRDGSVVGLGLLLGSASLILPVVAASTETKPAVETRRPPASVFTPPIDPAKVARPTGPLTVKDCYQLAVIRSETLGLREQDVKQAQALYWQSVGSILPNIHLLSSQGLQNGGGTPSGPASGRDNAFYSAVNVKQPIFRGFGDIYAASANKADIETRRYDRERTFQTLYLDTATVYYQILGYQSDLEVLAQLQKALEERITELDRRIKIGRSKRSELLLAQTTLAQTKVAVEQVKGLLAATKEMMAFLIGWPSSQITLAPEGPLPTSAVLENYLTEAGVRADILAQLANMRAETKRLSVARAARSPQFSFEGNYFTVQDPKAPGDWNMFIVCDLPLFDGTIEPRISQQKAVVRSSELNLEQLRRTTDREVRTAYLNFNTSISEFARLKETEEFAAENYAAQMSDYQLGRVTNLDVLDALQRLHTARRDSVGADADARINLVRLHVAAGKLSPGITPQPVSAKAGQP